MPTLPQQLEAQHQDDTFFPIPRLNRTQRQPIGPVRRHSRNDAERRQILARLADDTATGRLLEARDTVSRRYNPYS